MVRGKSRAGARRTVRRPANKIAGRVILSFVLAGSLVATGFGLHRWQGSAALEECSAKLQAGDLLGAEAAALRATNLMPTDARAQAEYGSVEARLGKHDTAYAAFSRALAIAPDQRDYIIGKASEGLYVHKLSQQETDLSAYVANHPDDGEATYLLAATSARLPTTPDTFQGAMTYALQAEALLPGDERVAELIGALQLSSNHPAEALPHILTGLQKNPDSPELLRDELVCHLLLGQTAQANADYASLMPLDQSQPDSQPLKSDMDNPPTGPDNPAVTARFVDVADAAGLDYRWHMMGFSPHTILETIGEGCAFFDFNNDGNLDILLVGLNTKLYQGDGHGHFTDVTQQTGLDKVHGLFAGCAVGDYLNDGYDDIFLTGYHCAALLRNEGGRYFRDVTKESGINAKIWSTSAAWGDIDNDGKLDLYVCGYADFPPGMDGYCLFSGIIGGCGPYKFPPEYGVLYHNDGNGHFTDVTKQWGMSHVGGKGLGAAFADFDGSGRQSLVVANDEVPSNLFVNTGRRFQEIGHGAGVAVAESGKAYSGMGVDWGDYDNDGKLDLAVMDFQWEDKRILHNEGGDLFTNQSMALGCHASSYNWVAFGTKWLDYDNSGWLGLILSSGHTDDNIHIRESTLNYQEPITLYRNVDGQRFDDVSAGLIGDAKRPITGRGLATGDFDNDGRMDVLIVDATGKPILLHNETPNVGHWIELLLIGTKSNRDGYGALVTAECGSVKRVHLCHSDGSYMSSSDRRVHIGLADSTKIDVLTIHWPSGRVDRLTNILADRVITVVEGKGIKP